MSRPEHLTCPNTAEGISRINQEQEAYDRNPDAYESEQKAEQERYEMEKYNEQCQYEADMQAQAEAEQAEAEAQQDAQEQGLN